jgi:hypothetical protein
MAVNGDAFLWHKGHVDPAFTAINFAHGPLYMLGPILLHDSHAFR